MNFPLLFLPLATGTTHVHPHAHAPKHKQPHTQLASYGPSPESSARVLAGCSIHSPRSSSCVLRADFKPQQAMARPPKTARSNKHKKKKGPKRAQTVGEKVC